MDSPRTKIESRGTYLSPFPVVIDVSLVWVFWVSLIFLGTLSAWMFESFTSTRISLHVDVGDYKLTASNLAPHLYPSFFFQFIRYTKPAPTAKTDDDLLKSVRKYTRTARKAWEAMSIPEDQNIDFEGKITRSTTVKRWI